MYKIFAILIGVIVFSLLVKNNVYENAMWNIPTRFCRPSRFYSPYDYRGLIDVPTKDSPLVFNQSEAIGEKYQYCHDDYRNMMD
jgi:hypothetical protein